jgi:hypothetical protein
VKIDIMPWSPLAGNRTMNRIAMWARLLFTATAFNLAGCAGKAPAEPLRSGSYALAEHQAVALNGAVSIRYDSFVYSRCPKTALCIWAGKVSYHFTLSSPAGKESFALDYEGDRFVSTTLPGASFGISFAGVRERPIGEHAVVLEVAVK